MKFVAIFMHISLLIQPSVQQGSIFVGSKGGKGGKGKTSAPSISPAPTVCVDNPDRFYVPDSGGNDMRTCNWVNRVPGNQEYPWRCRAYPEAAENCKVSCGTCPGHTRMPSSMPSVGPTPSPTASPSASPSAMPTPSPSAMPTSMPTASPSAMPTASPSAMPTPSPSAMPSAMPTAMPTPSPSAMPSTAPFASPSAMPTPSPSAMPSTAPFASPSAMPTPSPSAMPTPSPSTMPSASPTFMPTTMPTASPSGSPSASPTASPSASPTVGPTMMPSVSPTFVPTMAPTCKTPSKGGKGKGKGCTIPTPGPTGAPTPCQDSTERFFVASEGVTQSCAWVLRGGGPPTQGAVPWRCNAFPEASENCKLLCGSCGCVDSPLRFDVNGDSRSCEWAARKATIQRCSIESVKFSCPVTCGNCA